MRVTTVLAVTWRVVRFGRSRKKRRIASRPITGASGSVGCLLDQAERDTVYQEQDEATFLRTIAANVEALNAATASIPSERIRMHLC